MPKTDDGAEWRLQYPSHKAFYEKWRKKFVEYPFRCYFCEYTVRVDEMFIHHINEDHNDNAFANIVAIHPGCHSIHHYELRRLREKAASKRPGLVGNVSCLFTGLDPR